MDIMLSIADSPALEPSRRGVELYSDGIVLLSSCV